jgi:lipoate-protein ligase A
MAAFLRFYEWERPTMSLGFHQALDSLDLARMQAEGVPWVRRPTGGAAVLHSEELTYAVVVRAEIPGLGQQVQEWVSRAICAGLRELGVTSEVDERGELLGALPSRVSCFVRTSKWEVTAHGKKIVGSAQRVVENTVLQHGSILLGDDHLRIARFLRLSDDTARETLQAKLAQKATSVFAETGVAPEIGHVRALMETSFRTLFVPQVRDWQRSLAVAL